MRFVFLLTVASTIGSVVAAPSARAEPPQQALFDDDDPPPPVLINRARPLQLRVELSLLFMPTIIEKYLNHMGGVAAVTLHLHDVVAIEAFGGYLHMREAAIIGGAEFSVRTEHPDTDPPLPDLVGMSWLAQAGVALAPIYGKLNFFSEVDVNSQLYIAGGVGLVGAVKRQSQGPAIGDEVPPTDLVPQGVRFSGNVGFGFKLFLTRWLGVRAEFRDFIYSDYFDFTHTGAEPQIDVIHNFMGLFGLSFIVN